jgi:hypothetical protein
MHRIFAALIALAAWTGLAVQFAATFEQTGSFVATPWVLLRFFTIITNLLVGVTMTRVALGRRVSPFLLAGVSVAILFVGMVYALLLRGLVPLSGLALIADFLLHDVVPIGMGVYWLGFGPKIGLRWRDPILWSAYPLAYIFYVMVRGSLDRRYPYPFIDVAALGYGRVLLNSLMLLAAYLLAGTALVAIARGLARRRGARGPLGQQPPTG